MFSPYLVEGGPNAVRASYSPPTQTNAQQGRTGSYWSAMQDLGRKVGNRQMTERLQFELEAAGIQRYQASERKPEGKPGQPLNMSPGKERFWSFVEPIATLFEGGKVVGDHYMNDQPHTVAWRSFEDGSVALGTKKELSNSPIGAIPWVYLDVDRKGNLGAGRFANIRRIERVETVGGKAPPDASVSAEDVRDRKIVDVPYTARYCFYSGA